MLNDLRDCADSKKPPAKDKDGRTTLSLGSQYPCPVDAAALVPIRFSA